MSSCTALRRCGAPCMDQCKTDLSCLWCEGLPLQCRTAGGLHLPRGVGLQAPSCGAPAQDLAWAALRVYAYLHTSLCALLCVCAGRCEPRLLWDRRGRSMQSGCLSRCPGAARTALRAVVQPITFPLPSLAHAQVGGGLLCTPLLKRLQREGDGNTVRPLTLRVCSCLVTYKSYLNS